MNKWIHYIAYLIVIHFTQVISVHSTELRGDSEQDVAQYISQNYDSGEKRMICPTLNGVAHGFKITFFKNGGVYYLAHYIKGELNGPIITFNEKGEVVSLQQFKNNQLDGLQIRYGANGRIESIKIFELGKEIVEN